jgi:hypothetical protein
MSIHHLVFDTTDSASIQDSHSVGAHVRGGQGGAIITYHGQEQANTTTKVFAPSDVATGTEKITLTAHGFFNGDKVQFSSTGVLPAPLLTATDYWVIYVDANTIQVASSQADAELGIAIDLTTAGTLVHTITAQQYHIRALDTWIANKVLDVNMVTPITVDTQLEGIYDVSLNTNPDNVGLIAHSRSATPGDAQQIFRSTGATASSDAVVAANVQGLDTNAFGMLWNGTTWDRAKGTAGVADVNVTNTVTVTSSSDPALAAITLVATPKSLAATTATDIITAPLAARKYLMIQNLHNQNVYIGGAGVTDVNGYPLSPGTEMQLRAGAAVVIKAYSVVATSGNKNLRTLELS